MNLPFPPGVVPFKAVALANPRCVYVNPALASEAQIRQNYSFAVPSELESPQDYLREQGVFFAERYGGSGVGANGGAGRCGSRRGFQVKGIGRTPLVGHKFEADYRHSHGGMGLHEAIQEACWGEVFSLALPFGAARVAAIVATGTTCWCDDYGRQITVPRGLVVRERTIRPAHFIRAPYFSPAADVQMESDTARVRRAVPLICDYLPGVKTKASTEPTQTLVCGLAEMVERMAEQCAVAQSRRLMHGALTSSNIGIDGRWVDYGTSAALPTFANVKSFSLPRTFATLWEEQRCVERLIRELCFHINKYFPFAHRGRQAISADRLIDYYTTTYQRALRIAFLALLGVPTTPLLSNHLEPMLALGEVLVRVAQAGNTTRIEPATSALDGHGNQSLPRVLFILAAHADMARCETELEPILKDGSLRSALLRRYWPIYQILRQSATAEGVREEGLRHIRLVQSFKAGATMRDLQLHCMIECNKAMLAGTDPVSWRDRLSERISDVAYRAEMLYRPMTGWSSSIWRASGTDIRYDARTDVWVASNNGTVERRARLNEVRALDSRIVEYWKEQVPWVENWLDVLNN